MKGRSTLPACAPGGMPSIPVRASDGSHVRASSWSTGSSHGRLGRPGVGEGLHLHVEVVGRVDHRLAALVGDLAVQLGEEDAAGVGVLDAVEQAAEHPERGRHHAAGRARVHALGQHVDPERGRSRLPRSDVVTHSRS